MMTTTGKAVRALLVNEADQVAVLLTGVEAGQEVLSIIAREAFPLGHKIALSDIPKGVPVQNYGQTAGNAASDVLEGQHVHSHNLLVGEVHRNVEIRHLPPRRQAPPPILKVM